MSEKSCFKIRWIVGLLSFWAICYNYACKSVLPATMEAMVKDEGDNQTDSDDPELYSWSLETQNLLKEALFFGYILTGIIGGQLAERFSVKHTVGCSILISSLLSILFPRVTGSFRVAWTVRFVQGLANGMIYPGINCIFPRFIPVNERSIWGSIIYSGGSLGTFLMLNLGGFLSKYQEIGGWRGSFYLLGGSGICWYTTWMIFVYERPHEHPFITEKELQEISAGNQLDRERKKYNYKVPWLSILSSLPVYAYIFSAFVFNWAYLTMVTELPTYFHKVLGFTAERSSELASLPYISQCLFGYIAGFFVDEIRSKNKHSLTYLRKTFNSIGFIGSAICLCLVCWVGRSAFISVSLFTLALGMCGVSTVGYKLANVDMTPTFGGTLVGIANTISNSPGILAPMLVSKIVSKHHETYEWNKIFFIAASVLVLGAAVFAYFGSAEVQEWETLYVEKEAKKKRPIFSVTSQRKNEAGLRFDVPTDRDTK